MTVKRKARMVSFESTDEQLARVDALAEQMDAKTKNRSSAIRAALDAGLAVLTKRKKTG